MKEQLVLRIIAKIVLPFILMFGFYVQLHGEYSPGGGFQAGVIVASAFILYTLVFGVRDTLKVFPLRFIKATAVLGISLYAGIGFAAMALGGNFLNYSSLAAQSDDGQKLGILLIELGIGLTVCSAMLIIFLTFAMYNKN